MRFRKIVIVPAVVLLSLGASVPAVLAATPAGHCDPSPANVFCHT